MAAMSQADKLGPRVAELLCPLWPIPILLEVSTV